MVADNKKTKAELIRELAELRQRMADFEAEAVVFDDRRMVENLESRAFIDQMQYQSSNAIFTFDLDGRIQGVNRKGPELTGCNLEELINSPLSTIFSMRALPQTSEHFIRVSIHGEMVSGHETEIVHKDGNTRAVLFHAAPYYKAGEIAGVVGTTEDISKQKSIERSLNEKEERFQRFIEAAADAIMGLDAHGRIDIWNKAATSMFGYKASEAIGRNLHELIVPQRFLSQANKGLKAFEKSGQGPLIGKVTECVALRNNGSEFPVEIAISSFQKGDAWHSTAIIRDITERKKFEQLLRQEELETRQIIDTARDAFIRLDDKGIIMEWNPQAVKTFGWSHQEAVGKSLAALVVPASMRKAHKQGIKHYLASGEGPVLGKTIEVNALHRDGHELPVELSIVALHFGEEITFNAFLRDISERKQTENTLVASQIRHEEAQRIAHFGHWELDLAKDELIWSDENYRIFGVEPGTANTYETFLATVHPDDYEFVNQAFTDSVKNRTPYDIEHRLLMQDGSIKWVNERGETDYAEDGTARRSIGTTLDITERKQAGEALHNSEEQIRLLLDSTAEAIYGLDLDGNCTSANAACLKMLGYKEDSELIGKNMHELIHHSRADGSPYPVEECHIYQAFREGTGTHVDDEVYWRKDGSCFPVSYWSYPVLKDNRITGGVVTFLDISEQVKSRDALQNNRERLRASLKGTIAAVVKSVEARDPYTAGHQNRVAELAVAIAYEMGLDEERIEGIRMGASIHDIGKIQLPAEILSKPAKLSDIEYSLIQTHPEVGYDILKDIYFPWPVADIAHQHHERLDGSGYPQGLKGEEICLEARIVAVADVVEAMSSHRPYRPALGLDAALEEIENHRAVYFDSEVVDATLKLFREKDFHFTD